MNGMTAMEEALEENDVEVFPLTTVEDSEEETAQKWANVIRRFGDAELADEIQAAIGTPEVTDILANDALDALTNITPKELSFGYLERIDGYAFWSSKEGSEAWHKWTEEAEKYLPDKLPFRR